MTLSPAVLTYLNRCPLCTARPVAVRVDLRRYLADGPDGRDLATVEYGRGRSRKVLAWSELCDGCSDDTIKAKEEALLTPEGTAALEAEGTVRVPLDWQAIGEKILGLRD